MAGLSEPVALDALGALPKILEPLLALFELLVKYYGPWGTLGILGGFVILITLWVRYRDRQKDKVWRALVEEKERAVQRAAKGEREMRIAFLKQCGWSNEEVERFVHQAVFPDASSAREALERRQTPDQGQRSGEPEDPERGGAKT